MSFIEEKERTEVRLTLRKFILENYLFGNDVDPFQDGDSFLAKGIMDSTGILELINFLQSTYSIKIDDDEIVPENLDSLDSVSGYVMRKLRNGGGFKTVLT